MVVSSDAARQSRRLDLAVAHQRVRARRNDVRLGPRFLPGASRERRILTRRPPTPSEQKDIEFGWALAKEMGRLDVGQSVAVKERATLAVEAIEGTDRCIERPASSAAPAAGRS